MNQVRVKTDTHTSKKVYKGLDDDDVVKTFQYTSISLAARYKWLMYIYFVGFSKTLDFIYCISVHI